MYVCNMNYGIDNNLNNSFISLHNTKKGAMDELARNLKIAYELGYKIKEDFRIDQELHCWYVVVTNEITNEKYSKTYTVCVCDVYETYPKD